MATDTMATDPTNGAASPSPPPPTASAPGPRAHTLITLYNEAVTHILARCNYNNFANCFPTPAREVPAAIKNLHAQFVERLGESMRGHFEGILKERGVVERLNELDGLVEEGRRRKEGAAGGKGEERVVAPHTLPPNQLYAAHLAPFLAEHSKQLQTKQEAVQAENKARLERVLEQRKEIEALVRGLETKVDGVQAAAKLLEDEGVESLRAEVLAVEDAMAVER
ncbi:hypothetical protein MBLNU230_g2485t1 [Neophaeotheca triangularis]